MILIFNLETCERVDLYFINKFYAIFVQFSFELWVFRLPLKLLAQNFPE
jgi:hypothetical protein